ncbi:MAG: M23 family metallopeptidase [Acidimicrobiales bacterium]
MFKALLVLVGLVLLVAPHLPPIEAPVIDPFRPPDSPYGPGNRGIEYDTQPGQVVLASADGVVSFSGSIGSSQYVSIRHSQRLRTTYSFLASRLVVRGQRVHQGDSIGVAGQRFHFGALRDDIYIDPASLFGELVTEVRLVGPP